MGQVQTREDLLRNARDRINRDFPVDLKFPGFWDNESAFLREKQLVSNIASNLSAGAQMLVKTTTGLSGGGIAIKAMMSLLFDSTESIKRALLKLELREAIAQSAHCQVKAKMEVVKEKLESAQKEENMASRESKLDAANTACYELLILFSDKDFYLLKKPLAFAPFFVSFVSIYLVVLKAHYLITKASNRKRDATRVLQLLKETIKRYQEATWKARTNYVYANILSLDGEFTITDGFTKKMVMLKDADNRSLSYREDIQEWYEDILRDIYSNYFNESLQMVDEVMESVEL